MKTAFATLITLGILSGCATSLDKYSGAGGILHSHYLSGNYDSVVSRAYKYCKDRRLEVESINQISSGCILPFSGCDTEFHKYQFSCAVEQAKLYKNAVSLLPPCPEPDRTKTDHMGSNGRTWKWHNCVGRYAEELAGGKEGFVFEGEFENGNRKKGLMKNKSGDVYDGNFQNNRYHGQGILTLANGDKYFGEHQNGKISGYGTYLWANGNRYAGQFMDAKRHGEGIDTRANGSRREGEWDKDNFIREKKINLPVPNNNVAANADGADIERERHKLAEERVRLEEQKRQREQQRRSERINLQVTHTQPGTDGSFTVNVQTNSDTSSLKINGEELGGNPDGRYTINRVARAGQETKLDIVATDVYGNSDTKTVTVNRAVVESKVAYSPLNPIRVKRQVERDAVAVIIGISNYKTLPKAEFANDDARVFYDYAIRALGVKAENIKLLVDADADEVEIIKAFKTWLPSRTKSTTDVYVYYSGHGLPTPDGQGLYILPPRADRDFISRTSIQFQEINADIQAVKPKSVTIFMDACYSGQARNGETLVASARPIALKAEKKLFPDNFTVITASQADQISLSSPDLKHGIFSYYLMRGMEGDADANKDGKITLNEMQAYLVDNVSRHAGTVGQKQVPQVTGEVNQVLVGR